MTPPGSTWLLIDFHFWLTLQVWPGLLHFVWVELVHGFHMLFLWDFHFWMVATLLGWLPSVLHALWVVLVLGPADVSDVGAEEEGLL